MNPQPKKQIIRLKGKAYKNLQKAVLARDNFTCQYCGVFTETSPHHIIYRSQSGDDTMENMISLCTDCHRKVHDHKIKLVY